MSQVILFPTGDGLSYRLPSWATEEDRFAYYDITDTPDEPDSFRRFIIHFCPYQDSHTLHVINESGVFIFRYIDRISAVHYRLRTPLGEIPKKIVKVDEISIIGRVVEIWFGKAGERRWVYLSDSCESHREPVNIEHLGRLLNIPAS
jgi:hypothetical protein